MGLIMRHGLRVRRGILFSSVAGASIAALTIGSSQSVRAADIPTKALVLKAPATFAPNWTGFYVAGGVGYGLWTADTQSLNPVTGAVLLHPMRQGGRGWLGRVGGGYDYQVSPNIIVGVLADYDISSLKGTLQDQLPGAAGDIKQEWSWAAGGRAGWLLNPSLLSYFNGGFTRTHFSGTSMVNVGGATTVAGTQPFETSGFFTGGGVETSFAPGWFLRTEYRYSQFDRKKLLDRNLATGGLVSGFGDINFKPTVQTVTTQVVYKFNSGPVAPVYRTAAARAPASWSGVYLNAGGGYGMWNADTTTTLAGSGFAPNVMRVTEQQGGRGWLGRVGGGYDHQFTRNIVAGVFADFDFSNLKGTIQDPDIGVAGDIKQKSAWAAGARAGWLVTPAILSYFNVGYSGAHFSSAAMIENGLSGAPAGLRTPSFNASGWFFGGGTEAALNSFGNGWFGNGWFWRNEYRYASYDSHALADTNGTLTFNTINFKPTVQTVTTQLVYKFGTAN
jgi:outer membrane immunogenic protein